VTVINTLSDIDTSTQIDAVTNQSFSNTLASVLKCPRFLVAPSSVLKLILGEMSQLLLASQRVIPERLEKSGFEFKYKTLRTALEDVCN